MIPLYYRGEKLLTIESVKQRLHVGDAKVKKFLKELEDGAEIIVHGHRLFMDEEGMQAKKWRKELIKIKRMLRTAQRAEDSRRTSLLAPGYCVHRLGVYRG